MDILGKVFKGTLASFSLAGQLHLFAATIEKQIQDVPVKQHTFRLAKNFLPRNWIEISLNHLEETGSKLQIAIEPQMVDKYFFYEATALKLAPVTLNYMGSVDLNPFLEIAPPSTVTPIDFGASPSKLEVSEKKNPIFVSIYELNPEETSFTEIKRESIAIAHHVLDKGSISYILQVKDSKTASPLSIATTRGDKQADLVREPITKSIPIIISQRLLALPTLSSLVLDLFQSSGFEAPFQTISSHIFASMRPCHIAVHLPQIFQTFENWAAKETTQTPEDIEENKVDESMEELCLIDEVPTISLEKEIITSDFNITDSNPNLISTRLSKQKEELLELFDSTPQESLAPVDRFEYLTGEKFDSPIDSLPTESIAFQPVPNHFDSLKEDLKVEIHLPQRAQKNLTKNFQNYDLQLKQASPFSDSIFATSSNRLVNERLKRYDHTIDEFNNLRLSSEDISKEFSAKAVACPLGNKEGFGIEVELQLNERFRPLVLEQEMIFVLDSSKYTSQTHYNTYKAGVLRSLKSLSNEMRFNIIVVGKKVERLFSSPMQATSSKVLIAKRFLDAMGYAPTAEPGKLLSVCTDLIPESNASALVTLIVLSDNVVSQKPTNYGQELASIIRKNNGNFSLITASLETPHRDNLKLLSLIGNGENIEFRAESSFVRRFSSMVRSFKYPYMANIKIIPLKDGVRIYPAEGLTSPLYINKPYKFLAASDNNESFEILIQGVVEGKVIHIRKEIRPTLDESTRSKLRTRLQQRKAADAFEFYTKNPDIAHLDETNLEIKPLNIQL
ncbi:MAG: hypothetical protein ACOYK9_02180 [Chlamydiia bacterium]